MSNIPRIDIPVRAHRRKLKSGTVTNVRNHTRNVNIKKERITKLDIIKRKGKHPRERMTGDLIRSNLREDTLTVETEIVDKRGNVLDTGERTFGLQANSGLTIKKIKKMD